VTMTPKEMEKVIVQYEELLGPIAEEDSHILHIYQMLKRMRQYIPDKMDLANRWLGFVQGAMWLIGIRDIGEFRVDNNDDPEDEPPLIYKFKREDNPIWGGGGS